MKDRARLGFALMVVIAVVLGILIGTRDSGISRDGARATTTGAGGVVKADATAPEAEPAATAEPAAAAKGASGASGDYFAQYRLDRSRTRSRSVETLQQIIADSAASEEARAAASSQLVDLSAKTEDEAETEALIKARGYKDALVFVRDDACDVVILGSELNRTDAEQIGDIVARRLGVELSNITIVEREE